MPELGSARLERDGPPVHAPPGVARRTPARGGRTRAALRGAERMSLRGGDRRGSDASPGPLGVTRVAEAPAVPLRAAMRGAPSGGPDRETTRGRTS